MPVIEEYNCKVGPDNVVMIYEKIIKPGHRIKWLGNNGIFYFATVEKVNRPFIGLDIKDDTSSVKFIYIESVKEIELSVEELAQLPQC